MLSIYFYCRLIPEGVTTFASAEMGIPFFLEHGIDPNVSVDEDGSNYLEKYFFQLRYTLTINPSI